MKTDRKAASLRRHFAVIERFKKLHGVDDKNSGMILDDRKSLCLTWMVALRIVSLRRPIYFGSRRPV